MNSITPQINEIIHRLETSFSKNPKNLLYLSLLGAQYLERNNEGDAHRAIKAFDEVIHSEDKSETTLRAKCVAYSRRGKYYRMQKLYELALKDLSKARREKYFNVVSDLERESILKEYDLVQEAKIEETSNKNISLPHLEANINEKKYLANFDVADATSSPLIDSFYNLLEFLDKDEDSSPQVVQENNVKYWKGFIYCRKAIHLYISNNYKSDEINPKFEKYLKKASRIFQKIKNTDQYIPSNIFCYLAMVYHFLGKHDEALFEINEAISRNDSEVTYYKVRRFINLAHAFDETCENSEDYLRDAENDRRIIFNLQPFSISYQKHLTLYNEIKHMIEFYDQIKTDKNTYYTVIKHMLELNFISLKDFQKQSTQSGYNGSEELLNDPFTVFKNMEEKELINLFNRFEIHLKRTHSEKPISALDAIPQQMYPLLSSKLNLDLVPKRGETLGSLPELHLKAALICSLLASENQEKVEATLMHARYVYENERKEPNLTCNWARAHLIAGTVLKSRGRDEEALYHLELLKDYDEELKLKGINL